MPKKKVNKKDNEKQDDKILFAFLATFFTIVGFIIALATKREDKYVMFYAKEGLVLFIGWVFVGILTMIPLIGWFVLGPVLWIFLIILWVITWIHSLSGQQKKTWVIGDLAEKINL